MTGSKIAITLLYCQCTRFLVLIAIVSNNHFNYLIHNKMIIIECNYMIWKTSFWPRFPWPTQLFFMWVFMTVILILIKIVYLVCIGSYTKKCSETFFHSWNSSQGVKRLSQTPIELSPVVYSFWFPLATNKFTIRNKYV